MTTVEPKRSDLEPPWCGTQPHPLFVSKALLEECVRLDKIQAYDVVFDAYKVEGYWCQVQANIPTYPQSNETTTDGRHKKWETKTYREHRASQIDRYGF